MDVDSDDCSACRVVMSGEDYDPQKLRHTCTDRPVCKGRSKSGSQCTRHTHHRTIEYCKTHSNQALQEPEDEETEEESMNIDMSQDDLVVSDCSGCSGCLKFLSGSAGPYNHSCSDRPICAHNGRTEGSQCTTRTPHASMRYCKRHNTAYGEQVRRRRYMLVGSVMIYKVTIGSTTIRLAGTATISMVNPRR